MDLSQKTNDIGSVFEAAPANLSIAPSHHDKAITSINISVTHSQVSEACSVSRFNTGSCQVLGAHIQLLNFAYKRLVNKPYENEVTLTGQNPTLNYC